MNVIIPKFKFKKLMPSKRTRDKKHAFLLEVIFTGEGEANAFTFMALKDVLNERDTKNMVKELTAMKSKTD